MLCFLISPPFLLSVESIFLFIFVSTCLAMAHPTSVLWVGNLVCGFISPGVFSYMPFPTGCFCGCLSSSPVGFGVVDKVFIWTTLHVFSMWMEEF